MPAVAAYKWTHGLPVEDLEREALVLAQAERSGLRFGLRIQTVATLFEAQIGAAKEIQHYWFERWAAGERVPEVVDLNGVLRPQIIALGNEILAAAAADPGGYPEIRDVAGLSPHTRQILAESFAGLQAYPQRLAQILQSGVLRVGTTGDYAPFSLLHDDGTYTGIDIDLAADLARSLDARLELVPTSWPTLLSDLRAGMFDIAMSGVSRTLARQRSGYFSKAYYAGGKTAISRCEDADRFGSLTQIDQPGIRVVVNPGGTNEEFVDANIHQATKVLYADNRTIFAQISAGRADVMFTDAIEVELQTQRSDDLCGTLAQTLTYQEKGYLMPQDTHLQRYVDLWLSLRLNDGTLAQFFTAHGVAHRL